MNCPYCGDEAIFLTSKEFYGKDYGNNVYLCRPCDAYVGTHRNTEVPLGTLATAEVRYWRKRAHLAFDPMWRGKKKVMSRSAAYRWMRYEMGLSKRNAHIAMFNEQQCKQLIEKVKEHRLLFNYNNNY